MPYPPNNSMIPYAPPPIEAPKPFKNALDPKIVRSCNFCKNLILFSKPGIRLNLRSLQKWLDSLKIMHYNGFSKAGTISNLQILQEWPDSLKIMHYNGSLLPKINTLLHIHGLNVSVSFVMLGWHWLLRQDYWLNGLARRIRSRNPQLSFLGCFSSPLETN